MAPISQQSGKTKELPYNPIDAAMQSAEHARRTVRGVLESYNSNHDALAEAVQNSMDALEDAKLQGLPGPYLLEITIDLKQNAFSVLDTGIGMTMAQVCEAFAPNATFKDGIAAVKKRGDKYPYRGYKGVGLTFLAYGTDDVQIQSRQNGTLVKGRMKFGRKWTEGEQDQAPMLTIDSETTPLDKQHKRGTFIRVQFSPNTRPASLAHLCSNADGWIAIIRTRTAAGQILFGVDAPTNIKVKLKLIDKTGRTQEYDIPPEFYYPHLVQRNPQFRMLNLADYFKGHENIADLPTEFKRQDGIYVYWDTDQIKKHLSEEKAETYAAEIKEYSPRLYAFRPFHADLWSDLNKEATGQDKAHYFAPGLIIAVHRQRLADIFPIKASRSELLARNILAIVHINKAKPDQGRKTLQPIVMEAANAIADAAVQFLLQQNTFLKPAGEKTTSAQREVELGHEDWVYNVKTHAKQNPLDIPPVCYTSIPVTEQDVTGLFNQFAALGLFPGLSILATSSWRTYDSYVQFHCKANIDDVRYDDDKRPLGLSTDVLSNQEKVFKTRGLTLEFKNNLEGLISDLESPSKKKSHKHIDVCVCWSSNKPRHTGYEFEEITVANLHERKYPGVTHVLRKDGESHDIQVILLESIIKKIDAGQITL